VCGFHKKEARMETCTHQEFDLVLAAARGALGLPPAATAQIAAAFTAIGGGLSAEEHAQLGTAEPIVRVAPDGKVWVDPKLAKVRRKRRPRPPARRVKVPAITPRARSRAPRRHKAAGTKTPVSRAGPNGDPDEPAPLAAASDNSIAERGSGRHDAAMPMSGNLVRFPLRAIPCVLVCRERGSDGWLTLVGDHGWAFESGAEARAVARWLSRNTGLPVRELIGGVS
jgi:hypothetical protein